MSAKIKGKKYKIDARKWPGVYGYDSDKRKISGKPDTCYYIAYRAIKLRKGEEKSVLVWEKVGWKSEGYTPQIASEERSTKVRQARHGETVKTAKEIAADKVREDRTLGEIADTYFESKGTDLKGRKTDLNRYENHLEPLFKKIPVSRISPLDIDRVKSNMKGLAPATVANALELLRRIINFGSKKNLCSKPAFTIELPKVDNEVTEYLEPEDAERFVKVLDSWRRQDVARMLKLAMLSGMRRGEIFKLKSQDLDFKQRLIWLKDPKGNKTVSIPMNDPVKQLLEDQIKWRKKVYPGSHHIFPGKKGGQRKDCSAVRRIKTKAKLPNKFRIFHGLRHHMAVMLANSGEFSLEMIGELLTHKSTEITKRYSQFLPGTMQKASNRAADIIQEQMKKNQTQM